LTAIAIDSLSFRYPNRDTLVLEDFNLCIEEQEVVAVIGKSGCGKSTLVRLIAGLLYPVRGTISVQNHLRVGMVFQDPRLLPWKTVAENIALAIRHHDQASQKQKIQDVLSLVGLEHAADYYPKELSGGMAQRVALARALAQSPDILLMDEPFGALDAITRAQIQIDFEKIQQKKKMTVVLITHEVNEAVRLADRVVILSKGKLSNTIPINLSHPRDITDIAVAQYASQVLSFLTKTW